MAPKGKDCFYVLVPVPNNQSKIDWKIEGEKMKNLVIDKMENDLMPNSVYNTKANASLRYKISDDIEKKLSDSGFKIKEDYIIQFVPNITNITYGRGVGYKIEQESFESEIESISATKIRKKLRNEGKIK